MAQNNPRTQKTRRVRLKPPRQGSTYTPYRGVKDWKPSKHSKQKAK